MLPRTALKSHLLPHHHGSTAVENISGSYATYIPNPRRSEQDEVRYHQSMIGVPSCSDWLFISYNQCPLQLQGQWFTIIAVFCQMRIISNAWKPLLAIAATWATRIFSSWSVDSSPVHSVSLARLWKVSKSQYKGWPLQSGILTTTSSYAMT